MRDRLRHRRRPTQDVVLKMTSTSRKQAPSPSTATQSLPRGDEQQIEEMSYGLRQQRSPTQAFSMMKSTNTHTDSTGESASPKARENIVIVIGASLASSDVSTTWERQSSN